ncbi:hypothetical protein NX86_06160 [Streptococcus phocae subsp. salmonis]|nr:hypothetical protein NX86_06160 [Streptococcus phocae subsp. salmonis]
MNKLKLLKDICYSILLFGVIVILQILFTQNSELKIINSTTLPTTFMVYNNLTIRNKIAKILASLSLVYLIQKTFLYFLGDTLTVNLSIILLIMFIVFLVSIGINYKQNNI